MRATVLPIGFLFSLILLLQAAPAVEPEENNVEVEVKIELPILAKIPYLGKLFQNSAAAEACEGEGSCETEELQLPPPPAARIIRSVGVDSLERIGVDFDVECLPPGPCPVRPAGTCPGPTVIWQAPAAACPPRRVECVNECDVVCPAAGRQDAAMLITLLEARQEAGEKFRAREQELMKEVYEAKLASAVHEATLKARDEAGQKQTELLRELVTTMVENAKLQAKAEVAEERLSMLEELYEAKAELAGKTRKTSKTAQSRRSRGDAQARRAVESMR